MKPINEEECTLLHEINILFISFYLFIHINRLVMLKKVLFLIKYKMIGMGYKIIGILIKYNKWLMRIRTINQMLF